MRNYEDIAIDELKLWKQKMTKEPSLFDQATSGLQKKINSIIPDKAHQIITDAIKNMVKMILFGSGVTSSPPLNNALLEDREKLVKDKLKVYRTSATASGAWTGAGGILLGLADFPILLGIKMKFLFEAAALYGYDTYDFHERLFLLYIFQLAFSSPEKRKQTFHDVQNWEHTVKKYPRDIDSFDWRTFQQEYRDYIDLVKLFQLIPGIGAVVGAIANYSLLDRLAETTMNAYRMRIPGFS